ncbi:MULTISPECIES: hypothetical protein [unclassified Microbacterium]|uniref:hypothetical protein n=1 Tax=unclassified Microbacterium TaxID=2609290 RepID=UPI00346708F1
MSMTLPGFDNETQNGPNLGGYGQGATESEIRQAIGEIEADIPMTGIRRILKASAIALAISIDAGNRKGRAVANENRELVAVMQQLSPATDDAGPTDDSHLTPETRRLLDALAAPAQLDAAPEGDAPEL